MSRISRCCRALLLVSVLAACRSENRPADSPADTAAVPATVRASEAYPPAVVAQLDSGNAAYSAGQFDQALRHYRLAAEAGPAIPATWFGIYMTHHALGNAAAADSAIERARALSPTAAMPGALDSVHR
jgi:tetratricopeptide (TPR) repeat protein